MKRLAIASLLIATVAHAGPTDDAVKERISKTLRDPSSAVYGKIVRSSDGNTVCGWVKGKNGFGGYADWAPFAVIEKDGETKSGVGNGDGARALVLQRCREANTPLDPENPS